MTVANQGILSVDGAWFGWFLPAANSTTAELWLFDGDGNGGGEWVRSGQSITKDGVWPWCHIMMRQDYDRQSWDLSASSNGNTPVLAGVDFTFQNLPVSKTEIVFAVGSASGVVHLDDLRVMDFNPSFTDHDWDGMEDALEPESLRGIDNRDADSDGDGITDISEYFFQNAAAESDTDSDLLTLLQEDRYGTNPLVADTDGDGVNDAVEVTNGSDPRNRFDSVITSKDCMQNLTITVGGDATAGNWAAVVHEILPNGGLWERFRLVTGNTVTTADFKCRAACNYEVSLVGHGGTGARPAFRVQSDFVHTANTPGMATQPTAVSWVKVLDPFELTRMYPSLGTDLPAVALTGLQAVQVNGLPPVVLETPGPGATVLTARLDQFLLREGTDGKFPVTLRQYNSLVNPVLQTTWPFSRTGTGLLGAEPLIADGEVINFRQPPVSIGGAIPPRIVLRDPVTQQLLDIAQSVTSTVDPLPPVNGFFTYKSGCGCPTSASSGEAGNTTPTSTDPGTGSGNKGAESTHSSQFVQMGGGRDSGGAPNSAFMDVSSPTPSSLAAIPANIRFAQTPGTGAPTITTPASGVKLSYPNGTEVTVTNPTSRSVLFSENRLPNSGPAVPYRSVAVDYTPVTTSNTNLGGTYPTQPAHSWSRTVQVSRNDLLNSSGTLVLDSKQESIFTSLTASGIFIENTYEYSPSNSSIPISHTKLTYQLFSWGRELIRQEKLATAEDVAVSGIAAALWPDAASAGGMTATAGQLIQAEATAYEYWTSPAAADVAKQGLLKASLAYFSDVPQAPSSGDWQLHSWSFTDYDTKGRITKTVTRDKAGTLTLGANGLPVAATETANRREQYTWGNSTGNLSFTVTKLPYIQTVSQGSTVWTTSANMTTGSVAVTTNDRGNSTVVTKVSTTGTFGGNSYPARTTTTTFPSIKSSQVETIDPANARITITDNAEGTVTYRYQHTNQPLQKVEVWTAGAGPKLISRTEYFYSGLAEGPDWLDDHDYAVRAVQSDGRVEYTEFVNGKTVRHEVSGGSSVLSSYDERGRLIGQTEYVSTGTGTPASQARSWVITYTGSDGSTDLENVVSRRLQDDEPNLPARSVSISTSVGNLSLNQSSPALRLSLSASWRTTADLLISDSLTGAGNVAGFSLLQHNRSKAFPNGEAKSTWGRVGTNDAFVPVTLTTYGAGNAWITTARCGASDTETSTPAEWVKTSYTNRRVTTTEAPGDAASVPARSGTFHYYTYDSVGRLASSRLNTEAFYRYLLRYRHW